MTLAATPTQTATATATQTGTDERRKRAAWKPLAAAGIGGAVLVATGFGVFAQLQATASNVTPQQVSTGTLSLRLSNEAGFTQTVANVAPNDTVSRFVSLTNDGSLAARDLTVKLATTGSTALVTDGTSTKALRATITSCTGTWTATTTADSGTCNGTPTDLLTGVPLSTLASAAQTLTSAVRAAGAVTSLRITLTLPDQNETTVNGVAPTSTIQGQTANLTWTFTQTQRTGTTSNA